MILLIILTILITLLLNILIVGKITRKAHRICISIINVLVLVIFLGLVFTVGVVKKNLNHVIDDQITSLEQKANKIYPDLLDIQMDTSDIKEVLEESLVYNGDGKLETIASNILKSSIENYSSIALSTINKLERTENKLSIKEAILSLKELLIEKTNPYYSIAYTVLVVVFGIWVLCIFFFSMYLVKNQTAENNSIIFGDEAAKTEIGMK